MTALDPVSFVRSTPPFDSLPQELFDGAAKSLEVIYHPAGTRLVTVGEEPLKHLYVIRKGAVRLERAGQTLQVLEEGETFGYTSLITGKATLDGVVEEDLLAYRIPGEEFRRLLADARFAGHFAAGLATRLESSLEHSPVATFRVDLMAPVETPGAPVRRLGGGRPPRWATRPGSWSPSGSRRCWSAASRPASSPTVTSGCACWPRGSGRRPR